MARFILKHMRSIWTILSLILLGLSGIALAVIIEDSDLSSTDSSAIFGGEREFGYPSAGYLLSYKNISEATICGAVLLDSDLIITAAHCLNETSRVFLNNDDFRSQISLSESSPSYYKKDGWDGVNPTNDLAAVLFDPESSQATSFASIGKPELGCGYRVVGYGRTEEDRGALSTVREKKSASLCIENLDNNIIIFKGDTGGICLGDSGSPVFREGTNQIVGIISSVVVPEGDGEACFIGNRGVAVRIDTNIDFVNAVALGDIETVSNSDAAPDLPGFSVSESTDIEATNRISDSNSVPFNIDFEESEDLLTNIPVGLLQTLYFIAVTVFVWFVVRVWLGFSLANNKRQELTKNQDSVEKIEFYEPPAINT